MTDEEERRAVHAELSARQEEVSDLGDKIMEHFVNHEPVIVLGVLTALVVHVRSNFTDRPQGDRTFCWFIEQALDMPLEDLK